MLAEHAGLSVWIITKSPLITRDVDLLRRIQRHNRISVHISLITLDRDLARRLEPRAPTPDARLRALARLRDHGIEAGINVMPVLPGITDRPDQLEPLVKAIAEAGATYVNACAHQGLPLDNAIVDATEGTLTCPWHGFCYDSTSGECLTMPGAQLEQLPLRVQDGHVWVRAGG